MSSSARKKAAVKAIKGFAFWNYGLNEVDPESEFAEWVPDLADAVLKAVDAVNPPTSVRKPSR